MQLKSKKKKHFNFVLLNLNFRPLLRKIKAAGEKNIVLDCKTERLASVLEQALQVGLMGDHMNYIITDMVCHI